MASTRRLLAAALLVAACGGSSGPGAPFGLTTRTIVQGLSFPTDLPQPGQVQIERAFSLVNLSQPLYLTAPPDGTDRIFVVQKGGRIVVFPNSDASSSATTFLDVNAKYGDFAAGGEMGLLGMAFDPSYASNGYFYVTYNRTGRSVISRFSVSAGDPDVADPNSEQVLLTVTQPASNHNGGWMGFGPDGMLYLSLGDGGSQHDPADHGQNLGTLLGSILRIDPHGGTPYGVPTDNPFVGDPSARPEIWAYGLRNPWRCSFDRVTGDLWVGDVGQNAIEEVSLVRRGDNCGWRIFEGTLDHNNTGGYVNSPVGGFRPPVRQHSHTTGRSVTGGYVYRGTANPSLVGSYVYGDYTAGRVWAMVYDGNTVVTHVDLGAVSSVAGFGEDEAGELYAVSLSGSIWRFRETGGGPPPPAIPATLSASGLFSDTANLVPAPGLIEYEVNAPLWSDNARKRRWIALPGPSRILFDATDEWTFPQGTVLVKHFELDLGPGVVQRLETRVLFLQAQGWTGVTYRWNAAQTDADLLSTAETQDYQVEDPTAPGGARTQTWYFPSQGDCLVCHTEAAGRVLGVRTRQLNRDHDYGTVVDNQLRAWNHIGLFDHDIGSHASYEALADPRDLTAAVEDRARSYLAANCAMCHQPGGPAPSGIDLRYGTALGSTNLVDVAPTQGTLGLPNAMRIASGVKESSVLWERMRRLDGTRMPTLASNLVDDDAVDVIGAWIDGGPD